jgi:outer membrane protein W
MLKRKAPLGLRIALGLAAAAVLAPAYADAQVVRISGSDSRNAINFNVGYFSVLGTDSRDEEDTIVANLPTLLYEVNDFNGWTFGGEWLFGVNDYLETGVGLGFYQKTVPSIYADVTHADDTEIAQDLKLRIVPITATVRFLPIGRNASIQPYIGGGIGFFNWKYSEVGEFVDFADDSVFFETFVKSGNSVGPVILGGVRFPVGDMVGVGGEFRWQRATGDGLLEEGFLGDKVDLGGWTTNFTFQIKF